MGTESEALWRRDTLYFYWTVTAESRLLVSSSLCIVIVMLMFIVIAVVIVIVVAVAEMVSVPPLCRRRVDCNSIHFSSAQFSWNGVVSVSRGSALQRDGMPTLPRPARSYIVCVVV